MDQFDYMTGQLVSQQEAARIRLLNICENGGNTAASQRLTRGRETQWAGKCGTYSLKFVPTLSPITAPLRHQTLIPMASTTTAGLADEMELEAFRRLFPLPYQERFLRQSLRPLGSATRPLHRVRDTTVSPSPGPVTSADGSALVKIGDTTMLAVVKLEVMTPGAASPDEGCFAVEFHMPPICSPVVRPGRPAEAAPVIAKQLLDVITSSCMINLKDLSIVSGKAALMAYVDVYCLNADGSLFDAALLSAVAALSHLEIPPLSVNKEGRVIAISEETAEGKLTPVNESKRKLLFKSIPFSLTCSLHTTEETTESKKTKYILPDPTAEEEAIMDTFVTIVLDSSGRLVSIFKAGGAELAFTSTVQDCISLAKGRVKELNSILEESLSDMMEDE